MRPVSYYVLPKPQIAGLQVENLPYNFLFTMNDVRILYSCIDFLTRSPIIKKHPIKQNTDSNQ